MAHLAVQIVYHLLVGQLFIRLPPHGPYLVEDHPETPHVTGRGVLSIEECLGGHPLDREWSVLCGFVVAVVHQVSGHPEIPNLQSHIANRYQFSQQKQHNCTAEQILALMCHYTLHTSEELYDIERD